MTEPVDTTVTHGGVRLATTDFGGEGPSLVLMPGLGLTRRSLARLAASLADWRVITVDLRGHGDSSTAPWDFESAVADLEAVGSHYELERPFLAGHSLGGMVALRYALAGRPTAGVVNIDGWGPGIAERYLGEDVGLVEEELARFAQGELPGRAARVLSLRSRQWKEGTTREVLQQLHGADVVAWHRDAPCPSLAVLATAPTSRAERWLLGGQVARRQDAHRRGLQRDLGALTREQPRVSVVEVDAGHALVATRRERVASAIDDFRRRVEATLPTP